MFRKENGVTLVALVITIIVLLILAGVTISMVLGDDGIISQASDATVAQAVGNVKDAVNISLAAMRTEDVAYDAGVLGDDATDPRGASAATTAPGRLIAELEKAGYNGKVTTSGTDGVKVSVDNVNGLDHVKVTVSYNTTTGNYSAIFVGYETASSATGTTY